jgi:hypothetical protein
MCGFSSRKDFSFRCKPGELPVVLRTFDSGAEQFFLADYRLLWNTRPRMISRKQLSPSRLLPREGLLMRITHFPDSTHPIPKGDQARESREWTRKEENDPEYLLVIPLLA